MQNLSVMQLINNSDLRKRLGRNYIGFEIDSEYVEISNYPLTLKFDAAIQLAKTWDPDGLVIIGSDDIISKSIFGFEKRE